MTLTLDSECSGTTGLQRAQKSPCYTSLCVLALATSCSSHPVQDTDCLHIEQPQAQHPTYFHSLLRIYVPSRSPAYFHSLLRIYIPSRSPAYFHSLLRIYIPPEAPAYFHSLLRIYIPSRSPAYFHSLLRIYVPSRSLRSASERRLVIPSQRGSKSLSRTFSFTVPGRWNDIPIPIRTAGSLAIFKQQLKLISFNSTYYLKKIKNLSLFQNLYLSLLPLLACTYFNNA